MHAVHQEPLVQLRAPLELRVELTPLPSCFPATRRRACIMWRRSPLDHHRPTLRHSAHRVEQPHTAVKDGLLLPQIAESHEHTLIAHDIAVAYRIAHSFGCAT